MKILCICPIGIGNYLMVYPACRALKRYRPDLSLHLLGLRHSIRDLADNDPLWDAVHVFDPTRLEPGPASRLKIISALRRERFDVSVSLFPSNRWEYNALPLLAGIPKRWGFRYRLKSIASLSFLLTDTQTVDTRLHDVRQNLALAGRMLGRECSDEPLVFPQLFSEDDSRWAHQWLGTSRPLVGIHPGSSTEHGMAAKRWPPERFAALADHLCRHLDAEALVFGGPDEESSKDAVFRGVTTKCRRVEPVSLRRTAALLSCCRLCVCNDSGLMHMAACLGVPTVGIFGPTDERRNGPMGRHTLVVRKPMHGFPLWTAETVGSRTIPAGIDPMAPLIALTVDEAWDRIRTWLESGHKQPDTAQGLENTRPS